MENFLVVIYGEIIGFPPTFNMLNYLSKKSTVSVISRGLDHTTGLISQDVKKYFIGKNINDARQLEINILFKFYLYFKFIAELFKIIKRENPTYILAYDPVALAFVFLSSKILGKNFQIWYHNHDILEINSKSSNGLLLLNVFKALFKLNMKPFNINRGAFKSFSHVTIIYAPDTANIIEHNPGHPN